MKKILTHAHLIQAGMPPWDVAKFRLEWPDGCEITPETMKRAEALHLSPHVLFSAVCRSRDEMDVWYRSHLYVEYEDKKRELKKEFDAACSRLDAAHAAALMQRKCDLLNAAIFPEVQQ